LLGELLAHLEYLEGAIARLSERIAVALEPYAEQVERLQQIPGISREAAEMVLAEVGMDMGRFPSAAHLASWAGVCPGHHESAGKRKTGRTRQGNPWLKTLLVECGWGAGRARRTYLGAQYVRLLRRRGAKKAALAVGHSILVAVYYMLRDGVGYRDLGAEHFDRLAAERLTHHYVHRLEQLGHRVTLEPEPDVA
jgi:transposase